jgi:hypothetical protein
MKLITFSTIKLVSKEYYPAPASKYVPEWYKKTESYIGGKKIPNDESATMATIKRCMPVFDALTAGYIIPTPVDLYISQKDEGLYYQWAGLDLISFHPIPQAPFHPAHNEFPYPKFHNPWAIKTAPGYSTLFVQPFHRESIFTIMPGIVDTDTYNAPVNFPFTVNDVKYEGLVPAGTPMAQVIPIKRDVWQMNNDSIDSSQSNVKLNATFFDRYKNKFWHRKEYR